MNFAYAFYVLAGGTFVFSVFFLVSLESHDKRVAPNFDSMQVVLPIVEDCWRGIVDISSKVDEKIPIFV